MPPGTAEDDRVLPKTKNPYFIENYFGIFRNPLTPISLKLMKQAPNGASRSLEAPRKGLGSSAMQQVNVHSRKPE